MLSSLSLSYSSSSSSSELDELIDKVLKDDPTIQKLMTTNDNLQRNGWKTLDWKALAEKASSQPNDEMKPSSLESLLIQNRIIYVKRDDRLRLPGSQLSGNKARKLFALHNLDTKKFPQCVVSFGGPQSNAMVALAALVHFRNQQQDKQASPSRFVYYTRTLPRFLRNNPCGNLFRAQQLLGMELVELSPSDYSVLFGSDWGGMQTPPQSLQPPVPGNSLWVPQGGASGVALAGTRRLAQEIIADWQTHGKGRPLTVCLPGGTCSTAVLLHDALQELNAPTIGLDIQVVVIPCVGDELYSKRQMMALNAALGYTGYGLPTILPPVPADHQDFQRKYPSNMQNEYFAFGQPDAQILQTYNRFKDEHDLVLDLLYGAPSWTILLRHLEWSLSAPTTNKKINSFDPHFPLAGRCIMYVHSGGLEGINTQLMRYCYKGLIDKDDAQIPGQA